MGAAIAVQAAGGKMTEWTAHEEVPKPKAVMWMGSSRVDLKTFAEDVQAQVGYALYAAQCGEEYPPSKH
jgi:phage-related protein